MYDRNKKLYLDYINYHKKLILDINNKINERGNRKTYLFGAHSVSQYLISFGLNVDVIECVLDNNPDKHNGRLYGTTIQVNSPKILKDEINPIVILRSGTFNEEIKKDILDNINPNVEFLE